jgi:hypothetical protein
MDYISPEQATNSVMVTPLSDLYGLGCTMYYSLTGRVPFPAALPRRSCCGTERRARAGVALNPDIPIEFAAVVGKTLMKDPGCHRSALSARRAASGARARRKCRWTGRRTASSGGGGGAGHGRPGGGGDGALSVIPVEDEEPAVYSRPNWMHPFAELTAAMQPASRGWVCCSRNGRRDRVG